MTKFHDGMTRKEALERTKTIMDLTRLYLIAVNNGVPVDNAALARHMNGLIKELDQIEAFLKPKH